MKELESEAWEDFLDMTISQAILWAATNVAARGEVLRDRRGRAVLHRFALRRLRRLGQRSRRPGTAGVLLGLREHVHHQGPVRRRRRLRRLVAQVLLRLPRRGSYRRQGRGPLPRQREPADADRRRRDHRGAQGEDPQAPRALRGAQGLHHADRTSTRTTSCRRCSCSVCRSSWTSTPAAWAPSSPPPSCCCERASSCSDFLKEDAENLGAEDLHELMRCWENCHRMYQAEAHVRTILFREETRWPGYYFRADFPKLDNENWQCFVNCTMDPETEEWEMIKRDILPMFKLSRSRTLAADSTSGPGRFGAWGPFSTRHILTTHSNTPSARTATSRCRPSSCPTSTGWDSRIPARLLQRRVPLLRPGLGAHGRRTTRSSVLSLSRRPGHRPGLAAGGLVGRRPQGPHPRRRDRRTADPDVADQRATRMEARHERPQTRACRSSWRTSASSPTARPSLSPATPAFPASTPAAPTSTSS